MKCEDVSAATKWTKKYNIHYHGALPLRWIKQFFFVDTNRMIAEVSQIYVKIYCSWVILIE
jgi:hypothetical protein